MRVLVVEDEKKVASFIQSALEQEGYAVDEARDGTDALRYLTSRPAPPLILLDWNMAPMSGPQFMEEVKKQSLGKLAVVLLTADARVEDKVKTGDYVGFLKKPVKLEALFALLEQHVV